MCTAESESAMNEENVGLPESRTGASASRYASTIAATGQGRCRIVRESASARPRHTANPARETTAISTGVAGASHEGYVES